MTTPIDRPAPGLSREAIAGIEVGHTSVKLAIARCLAGVFLIAIVTVPVLQWAGLARQTQDDGGAGAWSHLATLPVEVRARLAAESRPDAGLTARIVTANRAVLDGLDGFQDAIDEDALLGRVLRPSAQHVLSGWLGAGNEQVYVGREGWLFYRPEVEYLTGPGFLEPAQLSRRVAAASEWTLPPQPDPRDAITHFARQLDARGITLVVMPTPVKPAIHPEKLAQPYADSPAPVRNPSYAAFVEDIEREGVLVFDVSEALLTEHRRSGQPQYLATDTHWRPESMARVAELLGAFLQARVTLPAVPDPGYRTEQREIRNTGDLRVMLDLLPAHALYPPETVSIRRVLGPDDAPWRASRSADVLVLGDSFTNIYSLGSMGWGDTAGFAEQVSHALRRPVDRIVQNADGAFATREMLQRDLAGGVDRLAGKRVVVYQFSARELSVGDWRPIDLAPPLRP